jgi:hypothetical protein
MDLERRDDRHLTLLAGGVSFVARPEQAGQVGPPWRPLRELPLTILVGVTGVGKSTTVSRLQAAGVPFSVLPNRREVADTVIIGTMQALDGRPIGPVADRVERLDYTRRYRNMFGGGMAHALTRLVIDPTQWPPPLLFDGLRGREEVLYALDHLAGCRFIVLQAPDEVRVRRLLGRGDAFDETAVAGGGDTLAALRRLPNIGAVFPAEQVARLAALASAGGPEADKLLQQVAIVVTERRNYDPDEAVRALERRRLPPQRLLVLDTAALAPDDVARRIVEWF